MKQKTPVLFRFNWVLNMDRFYKTSYFCWIVELFNCLVEILLFPKQFNKSKIQPPQLFNTSHALLVTRHGFSTHNLTVLSFFNNIYSPDIASILRRYCPIHSFLEMPLTPLAQPCKRRAGYMEITERMTITSQYRVNIEVK